MREDSRSAPDDAQRAQPGAIKDLQGVEVFVDGFRPFKVKNRREDAIFDAAAQFSGAANHLDLPLGCRLQLEEIGHHPQRDALREDEIDGGRHIRLGGIGHAVGVDAALGVRHVDGEEPTGEATATRPNQVNMTPVHLAQEINIVDIIVLIEAQQRIVVAIENREFWHRPSPGTVRL